MEFVNLQTTVITDACYSYCTQHGITGELQGSHYLVFGNIARDCVYARKRNICRLCNLHRLYGHVARRYTLRRALTSTARYSTNSARDNPNGINSRPYGHTLQVSYIGWMTVPLKPRTVFSYTPQTGNMILRTVCAIQSAFFEMLKSHQADVKLGPRTQYSGIRPHGACPSSGRRRGANDFKLSSLSPL